MLSRATALIIGGTSVVSTDERSAAHTGTRWRDKWQGLLHTLKLGNDDDSSEMDATKLDPRFSLMLNLYAHHPVMDDLRALYQHKPAYVLFLLSQLCNFWLNGESTGHNANELEAFLLEQCRNSITIAQRIMWFLLSHGKHAVKPPVEPGSVETFLYDARVRELARKVIDAGNQSVIACEVHSDWVRLKPWLAPHATASVTELDLQESESDPLAGDAQGLLLVADQQVEDRPPSEELSEAKSSNDVLDTNQNQQGFRTETTNEASPSDAQDETSPNKYVTSIKDCSEVATGTTDVGHVQELHSDKKTTVIGRGTPHQQFVPPITKPQTSLHHHKAHVPIGIRPLPRLAAGPPHVVGTPEFRWAESFYGELANISVQLKETPEAERNRALKASLGSICNDFLPSSTLCVPVKSCKHSVVSIVIEESFCFKTKERVPYMVCFEIIDHDLARGHDMEIENLNIEQNSRNGGTSLVEWGDRLMDTMELLGSKISKRLHRDGGDATADNAGTKHLELHPIGYTDGYKRVDPSMSPAVVFGDGKGLGRNLSSPDLYDDEGSKRLRDFRRSSSTPEPKQNELGTVLSQDPGTMFSTPQQRTTSRRRSTSGDMNGSPSSKSRHARRHSTSSDSADGINQTTTGHHHRTHSDQFERKNLGQFAPSVPNPVRGAGYDHFSFHKHLASEHKRETARQRANVQLVSSPVGNLHKSFSSDSLSNLMPMNNTPTQTSDSNTNHVAEATYHARIGRLSSVSGDEEEFSTDDSGSVTSGVVGDRDEEESNTVIFRERWADKENRLRASSPLGSTPGWRLVPLIVKSGDDLRQEQFASQLIKQFAHVFQEEGLPLYVRAYDVLAISPDSGLIEAVPDTISLDSLKKNDPGYLSLKDFFTRYYGSGSKLRQARRNFCSSLAAYCIVCYLLQIKDRHNGNLLLHADGHIIHIDFGFILSNAPGNVNFETAPFKLTTEFVQLLGGPESALFRRFRSLCVKGYMAARKHREQFILMVEMMLSGNETLPCFYAGGKETVEALRSRFNPSLSKRQCRDFVNMLIDTSLNHWRTRWYDQYQRCCVGIW